MPVKNAFLELKISWDRLDELWWNKKLTSIFKRNNVRLIRAEVKAAKKWYGLIEGKSAQTEVSCC
ncbi:hypothetical protein [Sphingobacterium sp. BIGb0165]|uniref:hypothetical protein n=1 Tax=Sphingobacterium sp. BIGb0165 TaxID=2940615 RepID=UPI0021689C78|nr:hypothetical protein [Sphingobacterium sp. BIGb0165]